MVVPFVAQYVAFPVEDVVLAAIVGKHLNTSESAMVVHNVVVYYDLIVMGLEFLNFFPFHDNVFFMS